MDEAEAIAGATETATIMPITTKTMTINTAMIIFFYLFCLNFRILKLKLIFIANIFIIISSLATAATSAVKKRSTSTRS